ncbi:MAG TPA: lysylphosphatidylglycerol synthase domain-containing protein [Actinomycetales bacterium]|nr:lysylphosphatidylglycerol synthase domain-containing protein [Actinomycetales bacterium]
MPTAEGTGVAETTITAFKRGLGVIALAVAVVYLVMVVDLSAMADAAGALAAAPLALTGALVVYAAAFALRAAAWCRVLPALGFGQSWAALHVSLLGNHVLPLRLGEALRVTSVLRRTPLPAKPVIASAVTLRVADVLAVVCLAVLAAPALARDLLSPLWVAVLVVLLLGLGAAAVVWMGRLKRDPARGGALRLPGPGVAAAAVIAWVLESAVVFTVAHLSGVPLSFGQAVGVTAVTIVAQTVAVTPGGIGSYEAAGTAALVLLGVPAGQALAVVLLTHAVKTAYSLVVGGVALFAPAPAYFGRFRLPDLLPERPTPHPVAPDAPVVAFIPAHDEEDTVGDVVTRLPMRVAGRPVRAIVVDDGSTDSTAERASAAGALVVPMGENQGLGAAVRRGLAEASALEPACVVYLDADGEYFPEDLESVAAPVLSGEADYVVGSRFAGRIEVMRPHRRFGNQVLTRWVRWLTRRPDLTDGQSGYRAFSPAAARSAEVVHDYNYAQVLTLDLLAKGFHYAEVPIRYTFRTTGTSFIRLGRYLRKVVPAVHRELNAP